MEEGDLPQDSMEEGDLPQADLLQPDTPQVFEQTRLTPYQRWKYIGTWIEGCDAPWPISNAACKLRYRLHFYGLLGLALTHYVNNAETAEYPTLEKHAVNFYNPGVSRGELTRRCVEIGAYTGGTDLDLWFRLYLHEIDLPFWRPGGYYQDRFGRRWTAGMENGDYLYGSTKPRRPAEDQVVESEVNRGDDLEVEELQEPGRQLPQQHHDNPGWCRRVLDLVVWLLRQWLKILLLLMLIGVAILVGWDTLLIAASIVVHAASAGLTIALGVMSYLARYVHSLGRIAWSFIRGCWGSVVDHTRSAACPVQTCVLMNT